MNKFVLIACMAMALTACSQKAKENLGLANVPPDEFAVITRAPLSVPPSFDLRPPRPGTTRPMEISTTDQARQTVFGVNDMEGTTGQAKTTTVDGGFLDKVGANAADPNIRDVVDSERIQGVEDSRSTADKILFWRDEKAEDKGTPIDPVAEKQRLDKEGTVIKKRNEDIE